jgi:outer membrane scaffolding protein for murein synthesis (MipA/OmpV family)
MQQFTVLALASLLCLPLSAMAADDVAGNVLTVGAGVGAGSAYGGDSKTTVMPILVLDYAMANGLFASTMRGLGYGSQLGPLSYSAALGYRGERPDHKREGLGGSDYLKGMGKVKGNASALLNLGYSPLPGVQLSVASDVPVTSRENGATVQLGASGQIYSRNDNSGMTKDTVILGAQASWGEDKYVQTMYGVTAVQAARTAFRQYTPKGGFHEAQVSVSWEHRIDARWGVNTMLGTQRRLGDAAKSPIVQRKSAPMGAVYVTYRY